MWDCTVHCAGMIRMAALQTGEPGWSPTGRPRLRSWESGPGSIFFGPRANVRISKVQGPDSQGPDFHKDRIPADEVRILCVAFSVLRNPVLGSGNPVLGS